MSSPTQTMTPTDTVTADFLANPPPKSISAKRIDFAAENLNEYDGLFAMLISNVLTPAECLSMLRLAESTTESRWEAAQINAGGGKQIMALDVRNCGRIIWDTPDVASRLLDRILPFLPPEIITLHEKPLITGLGPVRRNETYRLTRLNERLRFLKYGPEQYFREHCDGSYVTPDGTEISFVTIHLYLNDTEGDPSGITADGQDGEGIKDTAKGGATRFVSDGTKTKDGKERFLDVNPKAGSVLVFQHKHMWHEGAEVQRGLKYTVRTDAMYAKVEKDNNTK